jgi:hypothetical protein
VATTTEKRTHEEILKDNKEFAAVSLKAGIPVPQIALFLTLAALCDVDPEAVQKEYMSQTKLVQAAFRSL